ncbi:hypothetical protein EJB05_35157, partial [Eragrostis curvula]
MQSSVGSLVLSEIAPQGKWNGIGRLYPIEGYMETVISRIFFMAVENNEIKVQIQESAFVYTKKIEGI